MRALIRICLQLWASLWKLWKTRAYPVPPELALWSPVCKDESMRDIRRDLEERLEAFAADRIALQKQLEALSIREASVRTMLADEENRIRSNATPNMELPFERVPLVGGMQMTDLLKTVLRSRRLTFEEVKNEVTKTPYDFGDQKPGRVIHGGLLSLTRTGDITKDVSGRYGFPASNGIPVQERTN